METICGDKRNLRKFAATFALLFFGIGTLVFFKHKNTYGWYYAAGLMCALTGLFIPAFLKPFYIVWMRLALVLGWINSRILLVIIFYLIFTPISVILKAVGVDLLDRKIKKESDTYWKKKEAQTFNPADYERQF